MRNMGERHIQIAIDGLVASGKSTVGEAVAHRLSILYLDTGVMYRTVALLALEQQVNLSDSSALGVIAETLDLRLLPPEVNDGRQITVFIGDRDVTWDIRGRRVNEIVSQVSSHASVRAALIAQQQRIAAHEPVVMVGRDITSVVMPDAQVKIVLTASIDERVKRRAAELRRRNPEISVDETRLRDEIEARDKGDQANMELTDDTTIINTDGKTIDEVVDQIVEVTHERYP